MFKDRANRYIQNIFKYSVAINICRSFKDKCNIRDGITKDVHNIKKDYTKEKYMEYLTYEGIREKIDKLYEKYEEENTKTNRDYIIRQNRLNKDYLNGIKSLVIGFLGGIASNIYIKILDTINESEPFSINIIGIIGYSILLFIFWRLALFFNKTGINKYADKIEQYEINLIDKILEDKYNKLKGINNQEK